MELKEMQTKMFENIKVWVPIVISASYGGEKILIYEVLPAKVTLQEAIKDQQFKLVISTALALPIEMIEVLSNDGITISYILKSLGPIDSLKSLQS
jgi:hypothetical protein